MQYQQEQFNQPNIKNQNTINNRQQRKQAQSNIYYKGMNKSTLELIQRDGVIKARQMQNEQAPNGVYVSQSEQTARQYGEVILKMDLTGVQVTQSPHSNQYICVTDIPYEKIISITENLKPQIQQQFQQQQPKQNYRQNYPGVDMQQDNYY